MNYELKIKILAKEYVDTLVIALARQGYAPYITDEGDVCITIVDDELTKLIGK
jgi:hypothetical protein